MYDWYLDPNACLYGLHNGSEPFHIMLDPTDDMIMVANNTFKARNNLMVIVKGYDMNGKVIPFYMQWVDVSPTSIRKVQSIERGVKANSSENGLILSMKMYDQDRKVVGSNLYWLPDSTGNFPILQHMKKSDVQVKANRMRDGKIKVSFTNAEQNPIAFFIRISLIDPATGKRILPVFYSDNYISVEPGDNNSITIDPDQSVDTGNAKVEIEGWNVEKKIINIEK